MQDTGDTTSKPFCVQINIDKKKLCPVALAPKFVCMLESLGNLLESLLTLHPRPMLSQALVIGFEATQDVPVCRQVRQSVPLKLLFLGEFASCNH